MNRQHALTRWASWTKVILVSPIGEEARSRRLIKVIRVCHHEIRQLHNLSHKCYASIRLPVCSHKSVRLGLNDPLLKHCVIDR